MQAAGYVVEDDAEEEILVEACGVVVETGVDVLVGAIVGD